MKKESGIKGRIANVFCVLVALGAVGAILDGVGLLHIGAGHPQAPQAVNEALVGAPFPTATILATGDKKDVVTVRLPLELAHDNELATNGLAPGATVTVFWTGAQGEWVQVDSNPLNSEERQVDVLAPTTGDIVSILPGPEPDGTKAERLTGQGMTIAQPTTLCLGGSEPAGTLQPGTEVDVLYEDPVNGVLVVAGGHQIGWIPGLVLGKWLVTGGSGCP